MCLACSRLKFSEYSQEPLASRNGRWLNINCYWFVHRGFALVQKCTPYLINVRVRKFIRCQHANAQKGLREPK